MTKIGRNQPCPCGSGRKYKHCCRTAEEMARQSSAENRMKTSLMTAIEGIQADAAALRPAFRELGVFLFYSDTAGDAWLLEITESDTVQVARAGEALTPPIDENPETIEINFSHTFSLRDRQLVLTSYADQAESVLELAPAQQIRAAIRRVRKRYPAEMLRSMHVADPDDSPDDET